MGFIFPRIVPVHVSTTDVYLLGRLLDEVGLFTRMPFNYCPTRCSIAADS